MFYFFDDLLLLLSLFIMAIQIWFVISNIQHVYMYACIYCILTHIHKDYKNKVNNIAKVYYNNKKIIFALQ